MPESEKKSSDAIKLDDEIGYVKKRKHTEFAITNNFAFTEVTDIVRQTDTEFGQMLNRLRKHKNDMLAEDIFAQAL
ncbi:Glutamyl-tRNA reductase [Labeo rohita]|uniref:Glutamyl-tRNA reductase n=1 Tax=Labeo rohita TaxID=84645 RepID=A0ABQ8MN75_LABRO|nr:Glutamyl-tRNA reductase [Labeo rohita]